MKITLLFLLGLFVIPSHSQENTVYELSNFEELIVIGNFPVEIINSDEKEAVISTTDKNVDLNNLTFSYTQNVLTLKYAGSFVEEIGLDIKLYIPQTLFNIEARRGAQIKVRKVGTIDKTVKYKADSGGKLVIDQVESPLVKATVSKGGSIHLDGNVAIFEPVIKTGGVIGAVNLKAKEINASITFGGEIICNPIETLNASITSGGTINYKGNPTVNKDIKITGTVSKL